MTAAKKKYTIWYISKYALSPLHGKPTRQFLLSKYMVQNGAEVLMVSSRSAYSDKMPSLGIRNQIYYESEGVNAILLNGPLINPGFNFRRIYSWLVFELRLLWWALFVKRQKPDVIIVSSLSLLTFLSGIILKKRFHCKLVCEVRDIWPLTIKELKGWSAKNIVIRFLSFVEKIGYQQSDIIVGTMPNLSEHVAEIDSLAARKVYNIPMGFDPDMWDGVKKNKQNYFDSYFNNVSHNNFIVGYAGAIGQANCVNQIVEAASILKNERVVFMILGDGPLKEEIMGKIRLLKLKNINFLDAVPHDLVICFLQKCDLLLNPWKGKTLLYKYGVSPNKWIDYMYSGRPILVSFDGFPSIINEAECGKFVEADNPEIMAREILNFSKMDKDNLDEIGKNGRDYLCKNLSYNTLAKRYLDIIKN